MKTSTKSFKKAPAILAAFTLSAALLMSGSSFSMKASAASEPGAWQTDFSTIEEAHEYATELNNELMGEGCVLMKNNNDVLPLAKGTAVSVVGTRSYDIVTGGTGSGSGGGFKVDMPEAMNRADFKGTFPTFPTLEERYYGEAILKAMKYENGQAGDKNGENREYRYNGLYNSSDDEATDPYYKTVEDIPEGWTQATAEDAAERVDGKTAVQLAEMCGYDYWSDEEITSGPYAGKTEAEAWVEFVNQLTYDELEYLVSHGMYLTAGLESVGKDQATDQDGPAQLKSNGYTFCCSMVVSSTWNVDLAYEEGRIVGNDSLFTDTPGWYAPGLNIHRSPMGGRNFEYYSEDPFLSGMMTASIMKGLNQGGVFVNLKHFAMNEQETHRSVNGLLTWSTEQAMREIYLKGFEIAIKVAQQDYTPQADGERVEGGSVKAMGVMSSFNRIGTRWAGGDYRLLTTILRDEWGFEGVVICDFNTCTHMIVKDMVYAGGDLNLEMAGFRVWKDIDADSAADVSVIRQASKNILYPIVNSNAYRGDFIMHMPVWQVVMIVIDCVLLAGLAVWGFFAVKNALKKQNNA